MQEHPFCQGKIPMEFPVGLPLIVGGTGFILIVAVANMTGDSLVWVGGGDAHRVSPGILIAGLCTCTRRPALVTITSILSFSIIF